jgi:hypothetical protein
MPTMEKQAPANKDKKKQDKPPAGAEAQETAEVQEQRQAEPQAEIVYPNLMVEICQGDNAITVDTAKQLLCWETEEDYAARLTAENPGVKDADIYKYPDGSVSTFKQAKEWGDVYLIKDVEGRKVRCWNNKDNRPHDGDWSKQLWQVIQNFQWSGPTTMSEPFHCTYSSQHDPVEVDGITINPGDPIVLTAGTINGSSINISRTGKVVSGQHSLIALVWCHEDWQRNPAKYPAWTNFPKGPIIETLLVLGVSDDRRVLMTVDFCKPRSELDVFYTSELFRSLQPTDRKECSRMLAAAVDFCWRRTDRKGYKTHPEAVQFVDDHKRLLKCVARLFAENATKRQGGKVIGSRFISDLRLSPGQCAGIMYLMGCSAEKTDGDLYRNMLPPSEKGPLDWSRWDKAKEFWSLIGRSEPMAAVREALAMLVQTDKDAEEEDKIGLGGRLEEKLAILQKAWDAFLRGGPITADDVKLNYQAPTTATITKEDGTTEERYTPAKLIDEADFKGIDVPAPGKKDDAPDAPPPADVEAEKEQLRLEKAQETAQKLKAMNLGKQAPPQALKPATGPSVTAPQGKPAASAAPAPVPPIHPKPAILQKPAPLPPQPTQTVGGVKMPVPAPVKEPAKPAAPKMKPQPAAK